MRSILTGIFLLLSFNIMSQETIRITKEEALARAMGQNHELKIAEQAMLSAQADFRQTNALFIPKINVSHTGFITTNPLMAFGFKLNQSAIRASDFDPQILNDPDQTQNVATRIEFQQPLVNLDGLQQRKAARAKMEAMRFQQEHTNEYLEFEVERAYLNLQLAEKQLILFETNLNLAEENKKLAENLFEQGLIQNADLLLFEVRLAEVSNGLQHAKSNMENASDYLAFLMNETEPNVFRASDSLSAVPGFNGPVEQFPDTRSDLMAMERVTQAYANALKADKLSFLPNINAFGSYEMYDRNLFSKGADGYLLGIGLNWTLLDGSKRFGKSQKSKAEYEKAVAEFDQYKLESKLELNKSWRQYRDALKAMKLTELALEQSKQAFQIRKNRFEEGLEKATDLLAVEAQASQKELEYYKSVMEYNSSVAYLKFLIQNQL